MGSFFKYWVPVLIWLGLIFAGSTDAFSAERTSRFLVPFLRWLDPQISLATIAAIHFALRKLGHFTEYAILAALLWRAVRAPSVGQLWKPAAIVLATAGVYAALDEFHQSLVATRTASENDVMIDICGAIVGLAICSMLRRRKSGQPVANAAVLRQD